MRFIDCVKRNGLSQHGVMMHFCVAEFFRNVDRACQHSFSGLSGLEVCRYCWRMERKWYHFKKNWW